MVKIDFSWLAVQCMVMIVTVERLIHCSPSESPICLEYQSRNGCKNPIDAKCIPEEGRCICKDTISLYENGFCLKPVATINEPCWISEQCLMPGTKCFSKDGKGELLQLIILPLWDDYIRSNGSDLLVPGLCQCNIGYVFDLVEGKCISRLIDTPCLTNYDCLRRSSFSRCFINKCTCSPRHLYNSRNDKCVYVGEGLWPRRNCFDGSCRTGNPEQYLYNHSLANIFGFSLSMTMLMVVWIVVRSCTRHRLSERAIRMEELRYSDLRVAYDPFEAHPPGIIDDTTMMRSLRRETPPHYEDIQPPSYEEAVIKMGEPSGNK